MDLCAGWAEAHRREKVTSTKDQVATTFLSCYLLLATCYLLLATGIDYGTVNTSTTSGELLLVLERAAGYSRWPVHAVRRAAMDKEKQ